MDCDEFNAVLDRMLKVEEMTDDARGHLTACPRCRALHAWLSEDTAAQLPAFVRNRTVGALSASLNPVQRLPPAIVTAFLLLTAFVALLAGLLAIMGTAGLARMTLLQMLILTILLGAGATLLALSLSCQMRPGSRDFAQSTLVIGPLALAAIGLLFPWTSAPPFAAQGWPCLLGGLSAAAAAALLFSIFVRRGAPVSIRRMGATCGATAGWLGFTVLQYKCPHQEAPHLLVWHGGVLLVSAAAGLAFAHFLRNFRWPAREVV